MSPPLPRSHPRPPACESDLLDTKKGEVEAALAEESARRSMAEGRGRELDKSMASLSHELEVRLPARVDKFCHLERFRITGGLLFYFQEFWAGEREQGALSTGEEGEDREVGLCTSPRARGRRLMRREGTPEERGRGRVSSSWGVALAYSGWGGGGCSLRGESPPQHTS